jgi:hypothetical protein
MGRGHAEPEAGADFHFMVHNAAGIVSAQQDIRVTEALIRLRAHAFSNDRPLADVAHDVIARTLRLQCPRPGAPRAGGRPLLRWMPRAWPQPALAALAGGRTFREVMEMTREADVVKSLVEMADTLAGDYDVVDMLTGVADRCVHLLGVSAAGVMLASPAGSLALVASSSEAMRLLELFELQQQEGPCLDAFRTGEPVQHQNLQAGAGRWPSFSAAAVQAGFASALALPLRLREVTLGALNLLSATRTPMAEADVIVARAFADLAALSIIQHRATAGAQRPNDQLSVALISRVVIEQAKGVISGTRLLSTQPRFPGCGPTPATHNRRLTDVAQAAIDGTLDPRAYRPRRPARPPLTVHSNGLPWTRAKAHVLDPGVTSPRPGRRAPGTWTACSGLVIGDRLADASCPHRMGCLNAIMLRN